MTKKINKFYKLSQDLAARKDLLASDKIVFAVIADHIGNNGYCWPGVQALMAKAGLARQTVCNSIERLEGLGFLDVNRRGNGKSNHYKISLKIRPVQKLDQSKNETPASLKIRPEPVQKLDPNQTDLLNQTTQFDRVREIYPGTKRGLQTEFDNFTKKHKDWREVLPLLKPAIELQTETLWRDTEKRFIPHFQTWINQRRWENEIEPENKIIPFDKSAARQRRAMLEEVKQ